MHGFLPGAGQQGTDLQLHPQCWFNLHIFLGHQGKWFVDFDEEEEEFPPPERESSSMETTPEKEADPGKEKVFKCDQCENNFKSENGLKIHVGKTHKKADSTLATPERPRQQQRSSESLSTSPLLNTCREESTINPDVVVGDPSPPKGVKGHTCPSFLCSRYQCPKETEEQKRHYQQMQELLEKGSF